MVDDKPGNLVALLQGLEVECIEADNGNAALAASEERFNALVMAVKNLGYTPAGCQAQSTELKINNLQLTDLNAALVVANQILADTRFAMNSVGIGIQGISADTGRLLYRNRLAAQTRIYTEDEMHKLSVPDFDPNVPPGAARASPLLSLPSTNARNFNRSCCTPRRQPKPPPRQKAPS